MHWLSVLLGVSAAIIFLETVIRPRFKDGSLFRAASVMLGSLLLVYTVFLSMNTVPAGHVGVLSTFGRVDTERFFDEGVAWTWPWQSVTRFPARQQTRIEVGTASSPEVVICKDEKQCDVDLSFAYSIDPAMVPRVIKHFSTQKSLEGVMNSCARAATRRVFSKYTAEEVYVGKRAALGDSLDREFEKAIADQLAALDSFSELTPKQLETVFIIHPVQIENVLPPTTVRAAMNASNAADIELTRQKTLTAVAGEVAKRQEKEGEGLANILKALPKASPKEAADLLHAKATLINAYALDAMSKDSKISAVYISGGLPVSIK